MAEAKQLVHMAITTMLAAIFLTVAMGLIGLGYKMWGMFSKQDLANNRLREYSTYSSFDDTTVRGQEVITLMSQCKGDPFVVVYSRHSGNTDLVGCCYNGYTSGLLVDTGWEINTSDNMLYAVAMQFLSDHGNTQLITATQNADAVWSASNPTLLDDMQTWFLSRGANGAGYVTYKSTLIYDSDNTSDIVGILLLEN